jgi:UDP-2-acetamido-2-deoxy-ribo-hexuluronate aminotransferase
MDFIDLKAQQRRIKGQLDTNIQRVLEHGSYVMGPEVKELENKLASYVGVQHAVACASGTDALLMALMACDIGPGDAVFTTPFTFISTAEVISLLGATPVFVDIDPATYNIDPAKLSSAITALRANDPALYPLPKAPSPHPAGEGTTPQSIPSPPEGEGVTPQSIPSPPAGEGKGEGVHLRPRCVIPVDLFGLPADYDAITSIARDNGLFIIEDAAQSLGAEYKEKKAGSLGDIGCTSFFPAKPLGAYGDGGMCFTNDDTIAAVLDSIRVHGKGSNKYENTRIGINGRLDTLQAAVLLAKFDIFADEVERRQIVSQRYTTLLSSPSSPRVPYVPPGARSVWAQYSLLAENEGQRAKIMDNLKAEGIPSVIYYPRPLHLQEAFNTLGYKQGDFPVSEDIARRIFSIPMHPYLTEQDQQKIVDAIATIRGRS